MVSEFELGPGHEEEQFFRCAFSRITSDEGKMGRPDFELKKHFLYLSDDIQMNCMKKGHVKERPRFLDALAFATNVSDLFQNKERKDYTNAERILKNYDVLLGKQVLDLTSTGALEQLKMLNQRLKFQKRGFDFDRTKSLFEISARFLDKVPLAEVYSISFGIILQEIDNIISFSLPFPGINEAKSHDDAADLSIMYLRTDQKFTKAKRVKEVQRLAKHINPLVGHTIDSHGPSFHLMEYRLGVNNIKVETDEKNGDSILTFTHKYREVIKRDFPWKEQFFDACNKELVPAECHKVFEDPHSSRFQLELGGKPDAVHKAIAKIRQQGLFLHNFPHLHTEFKDDRKFLRLADMVDGIPFRRSLVLSFLSFMLHRPVVSPTVKGEFKQYIEDTLDSKIRGAAFVGLQQDKCFASMKDITKPDERSPMDDDIRSEKYQKSCLEHFSSLWMGCGHVVSSFWDGSMPHNTVKNFQKLCVWPYMVDFAIEFNNHHNTVNRVPPPKKIENPQPAKTDGLLPGKEYLDEEKDTTTLGPPASLRGNQSLEHNFQPRIPNYPQSQPQNLQPNNLVHPYNNFPTQPVIQQPIPTLVAAQQPSPTGLQSLPQQTQHPSEDDPWKGHHDNDHPWPKELVWPITTAQPTAVLQTHPVQPVPTAVLQTHPVQPTNPIVATPAATATVTPTIFASPIVISPTVLGPTVIVNPTVLAPPTTTAVVSSTTDASTPSTTNAPTATWIETEVVEPTSIGDPAVITPGHPTVIASSIVVPSTSHSETSTSGAPIITSQLNSENSKSDPSFAIWSKPEQEGTPNPTVTSIETMSSTWPGEITKIVHHKVKKPPREAPSWLTLPPDVHRGDLRLPPAAPGRLPNVKDSRSNVYDVPPDPKAGIFS